MQLPREAGRRESRYAHLFSGEVRSVPGEPVSNAPSLDSSPRETQVTLIERVSTLEQQVRDLQAELAAVRAALPSQESS